VFGLVGVCEERFLCCLVRRDCFVFFSLFFSVVSGGFFVGGFWALGVRVTVVFLGFGVCLFWFFLLVVDFVLVLVGAAFWFVS